MAVGARLRLCSTHGIILSSYGPHGLMGGACTYPIGGGGSSKSLYGLER